MKRRETKTPKTRRENDVAVARGLLSEEKVTAFFRQCADAETHILACKLLHSDLTAGIDLDTIFYTGKAHGYYLRAKPLETDRFEISFGCVTSGGLGDGGTWLVAFGCDGSVQQITSESCWIA